MDASYPAGIGRRRPQTLRTRIGRGLVLGLRYLMALFFTGAAVNKWQENYLFSDRLFRILSARLEEIDPESFGAWFIEHVGLPYWQPLAWLVCWGETLIALGLIAGLMTRAAAAGALLMMLGFAFGGFYDASLIVLALMFVPLIVLPTGHWFGLDRFAHARYPRSIWFR